VDLTAINGKTKSAFDNTTTSFSFAVLNFSAVRFACGTINYEVEIVAPVSGNASLITYSNTTMAFTFD
jgi:hypothetical protein